MLHRIANRSMRLVFFSVGLLLTAAVMLIGRAYKLLSRLLSYAGIPFKPIYRRLKHYHNKTLGRAHEHLRLRWNWYDRWHKWEHREKAHLAIIATFLVLCGAFFFSSLGKSLASSISWTFSSSAGYTFNGTQVQVGGNVASLKQQGTPGTNWIASDGSGNNWPFRLPITLTNSQSSTLTNYQIEIKENMVANWKLDEASTGTAADSSGNGYSGTDTSTAVSAGKFGNARGFNGSSSYVSVADNSALAPSTISLSVWVNPTALPGSGAQMGLVDKRDDAGTGSGWALVLNNNAGTQQIVWETASSGNMAVNNTLPTGSWSHIVVTQTGTTATMYVNGTQVGTLSSQTAPSEAAFPLLLGKEQGGSYFNGLLDEVRVYSRMLSTNEIGSLYSSNLAGNMGLLYQHAQSSGNDIRFTNSDGVTALNYDTVSFTTSGQNEDIWVNVPSIAANSSLTIYAYAGNAAASAASSFSSTFVQPSSISGLKEWLKADSIAQSDNTGVSSWSDSSGSGNGVTLPAGDATPIYKATGFNGHPTVAFSANNQILSNTSLLTAGNFPTSQATEFTVLGLTSGNVSYSAMQTGSAGNDFWRFNGTPNGYIGEFRNARLNGYPASMPTSGNHISVVSSGTGTGSYQMWVDGATDGAQDPSWGINNNYEVGANASATLGFYGGNIPEIIIYNTALSANDRNNIVRYLTVKYGLTDTETSIPTVSYGAQTTLYPTGSPTVSPSGGQGYQSLSAFSATLAGGSTGSVSFQISPDNGVTWYWWSGSAWTTASGVSQSNDATTINTNIASFTAGTAPKTFLWQAYLTSDGSQNPQLTNVTLTYINDSVPPPNPGSVTASGSPSYSPALTSGGWYNYDPLYFTWSAPTDVAGAGESPTGVAGYYVYFGTDPTADPLTAGTFQAGTTYTASALTTGTTYYLIMRTKDNAGNVQTASTLYTYKYDNVTPAAPDYVNVSPVGCSTSSTFTFTWPAGSDASSGIAGYDYKLGSTGAVQQTSSLSVTSPAYQSGDNVFYVRSRDNAGNVSNFQTVVFCSTAQASVINGPTVTAATSSITVDWISSKPTTSFVKVQSGNEYVSEQGQSTYTTNHEVKVVGLQPENSYQYMLEWTDSNGNTGQSPLYTTDTTAAPSIKNLTAEVLNTTSVLISWQTSTLSSATLQYGINNLNSSQAITGLATAFTKQLTGLTPGSSYETRVSALTPDGFPYYAMVTFQTPPAPAISNLRFTYLPDARATVQASWDTNVPTTSVVSYTLKNGGGQNTASSGELTTSHNVVVNGLADNTAYVIQASGMDSYGNQVVSDSQDYQTPFDTRPPVIDNIEVESSIRGTGADARGQVVVSWTTDEPSTSQVAYGEGSSPASYNNKTAEDSALSTQHIVIISDLPTSKIYSVEPLSKDAAGNVAVGHRQTTIIGHATDSILTIILNSLRKIFGL